MLQRHLLCPQEELMIFFLLMHKHLRSLFLTLPSFNICIFVICMQSSFDRILYLWIGPLFSCSINSSVSLSVLVGYTLILTHNNSTNCFPSPADIIVTTNGEPVTSKEIKSCIHQIQELIVVRLNQAVANKLISSVDYLRESFVGTLERCLNSLEKSTTDSSVHNITSNHLKQVCCSAFV